MVLSLVPLSGHASYCLKPMEPGWVEAALRPSPNLIFLVEQSAYLLDQLAKEGYCAILPAKSLGGLHFFKRGLQPQGAAAVQYYCKYLLISFSHAIFSVK